MPPFLFFIVALSGRTAHGAPVGTRFGFDWSAAWTWDALSAHVGVRAPGALPVVTELRRLLRIEQARIALGELSRLDDLAGVRRVPERGVLDRRTAASLRAREAMARELADASPRDRLDDMLDLALRLARARAEISDWFLPEPRRMAPSPSPRLPGPARRVTVSFDLSAARAMLDRLRAPDATDWDALADMPACRELMAHRRPALTREQLTEWMRRAHDPSPENRLYEWVYPGSFYDFGGVAAQADLYSGLLDDVEARRADLAARVERGLATQLPADLRIDARVSILFAGDADGWATAGALGIDLEHFGGDYDRLVRVVTHECLHRAQARCVLPVTTLADPESLDGKLDGGLLASAWREGLASYAGRPWDQPPTAGEVTEAFAAFSAAYDALVKRHDEVEYRARIRSGLSMAGALYRVGWHVAATLDRTRGRAAVVDGQTLGPALFFARYVAITRRLPASAHALRFRADIEDTILRLASGLDAPALLEAARVSRMPNTLALRERARRMAARARTDRRAALALVELGEMLARRRGDYRTAASLIVPGMRLMGSYSPAIAERESALLAAIGAPEPAAEVLRMGAAARRENAGDWPTPHDFGTGASP